MIITDIYCYTQSPTYVNSRQQADLSAYKGGPGPGPRETTFLVNKPTLSIRKVIISSSLPCLTAFDRVLPSLTCLSPVSKYYSCCQRRQQMSTIDNKNTSLQRYYDTQRRRTELAATGRDLPGCPGGSTGTQPRPGMDKRKSGEPTSILPERNACSESTPPSRTSEKRQSHPGAEKRSGSTSIHSPDSAKAPSASHTGLKAHPSHIVPTSFLHRSHTPMLLCLLNPEAHTHEEIHWTGLGSDLKNFFKIRFRSISGLAETQNATVASSSKKGGAA